MKLDTLMAFATLFAGRPGIYFNGETNRPVRVSPSLEHFRMHLDGRRSIGTYPVRDDASCRWGCIDIDDPRLKELEPNSEEFRVIESEAYRIATDVQSIWEHFNVASWIERSRSKGFHVWTFANDWVSAKAMRDAGQYVRRLAELPENTEVNPKNPAPWTMPNRVGNTVRLPYAGNAKPRRMVVVDGGQDVGLEDFVRAAMAQRTSQGVFEALSVELQKRQRVESIVQKRTTTSSHDRLNGQVRGSSKLRQEAALILNGQRDVAPGERDNQFYTMAKLLHSQSYPLEIALRKIENVYEQRCPDKYDFSLNQALSKVENVYR